MKRISVALACLLLLLVSSSFVPRHAAQTEVDRSLADEIFKIRAIDHHAHPMRATREGEEDREFDALIPDVLEPAPLPVRLRPDNPEFVGAWRSLWGYRHDDMTDAHLRELDETKRRATREHGDEHPAWVLDQLNIEVMFANRVAMGRGLTPQRFRWVAFDDALMLPLSSATVRKTHPDYAAFYPGEDALLKRYLSELKLTAVPATLREYTSRVVTPTLERQKRDGAVAVKFEAAYLRALDFADASEAEAARVYARFAHGGAPTANEYKPLQDFLFRYIAREAGRLG
ncbi:MAG: amidohydrolase, partial [Acidobacteria bacterium]